MHFAGRIGLWGEMVREEIKIMAVDRLLYQSVSVVPEPILSEVSLIHSPGRGTQGQRIDILETRDNLQSTEG